MAAGCGDSGGDAVIGHQGDVWCVGVLWGRIPGQDHAFAWVGVAQGSLTGTRGEMVASPVAVGVRGGPRSGGGGKRSEEVYD